MKSSLIPVILVKSFPSLTRGYMPHFPWVNFNKDTLGEQVTMGSFYTAGVLNGVFYWHHLLGSR